ncbi:MULTISPECIES: cellulose biosynthesis protein BcsP [unclassified Caballeronia]|uniref:cellulose biosynthesis protein BcsP n=1 Tax=unclassified Caballeronia TaxID=2646786 RepID=UPI002867861E|nr:MULTISPECIES: cellulose biosynthesis protein BcsP [unclassified Caballeronia]MDR5754247.1 cellulose biosynthesis protein BcsP [Caballeronia sp. LZ024]MDR5840625.1 cellulose biosynthesis protein BcsP [Caballeronia sp. LZ031]
MNTSRDIEKLFEHFGGNAGDYQEIGKENEARSARTRWPLLATLDFAQPPIPEVAQRRDVQLPTARGARGEAAADASPTPTPINRGKPPLFARAHRRTIPPVGNVTLPAVAPGASRFADAGEAAPSADAAPLTAMPPAAAPVQTPLRAAIPVVPAAPVAPAAPAAANPFASRPVQTPLRATLSPTHATPPAAPPARPAVLQPQAPAPAPHSILGKLFASPAQDAAPQPQTPAATEKSLVSVFDRLRGSLTNPDDARHDNPAASRAWATSRTSRS